MKRFLISTAAALVAAGSTATVMAQNGASQAPIASTNVPPALAAKYATEDERYSYAVGVMIAADMRKNLVRANFDTKADLVVEGFRAGFLTNSPLMTDVQANALFREHNAAVRDRASAKAKAEGEKFLEENKTKPEVVTLPSGLQYKKLKQGDGPKPAQTDTVTCHYRGTLVDGTEFDSSYGRGEPANFAVTGVIKGWTEALQLMPVGSKWQLYIPSNLAYGPAGHSPKIAPNSALIFDIELIGIKPPAKPAASATPPTAAAGQPVTSDIIKVPSKAEMDKGAKIEVLKAGDVERLQKEGAAKTAPAQKK
jgi:FKBP-type peptidyl-prolyl cis-trans isomerase